MMADNDKVRKILKTSRDPQELQDWMFSLIPLFVAFTFFLVFVWSIDLPHKDIVILIGAAAAFTGFEAYWIYRGWRKNHFITILFGLIGVVITIALAWLYITFA